MWGHPAETTFSTTVSPSSLPPRTDIGSFEIVGNSENRDVYVYWQGILGIPNDKNNLPYKVVSVEEDGRILDMQPHELTESYAKFTGISFNGISLKIAAATYKVANSLTTTVRVPSQLGMPQEPVVHTKIVFDGGIYELSWNPSNNPDITDYTIFWCENARDRPYICSGHLDWVHVPGNTHMYNITVPDPKKIYQFAIAANTARTSSGMVWFSSMTTFSNEVGKPKSVRINCIGSDSVEVRWELPYSGRIGIVEGFNMYYCPILSPYKCEEPKVNTFVRADQHLTSNVVHSLKPFTTYLLTVAVLSRNGEGLHSTPLYFTTLEAELDPPLTGTSLADTCLGSSLVPINTKTSVEQSLSDVKDFMEKLMLQHNESLHRELDAAFNDKLDSLSESIRQRDKALDDKLSGLDELNSRITDAVTQVFNLTLPISAVNVKLDSLSESTKQRDEALDRKLNGIEELKSKITESVTQVSNLTLPISAFDHKLDSVSESIKRRDKALDDKLDGIDELNSRITDSVTKVSNLGQTISAFKVELVSLSEENCQLRDNLTQCNADLDNSFGRLTLA